MHRYPSVVSAAQGLLGEVVQLLQNNNIADFAVIGGWSPFFLNRGAVSHPGSRDVDLLFQEGRTHGSLRSVVTLLVENGYLHSAKHEFQLVRELDVAGTTFVFNVDILHPSENKTEPELFAEHVTLPVPLSDYTPDSYIAKSIVVPTSQFIFRGHVVPTSATFDLPNGARERITLPLMNEVGLIATKAGTLCNPKRPRDSFDVFLAIKQARNYSELVHAFKRMSTTDPLVFATLYGVRDALADTRCHPVNAALRFVRSFDQMAAQDQIEMRRDIAKCFEQFLLDVDLPEKKP